MSTISRWTLLVIASFAIFALTMFPIDVTRDGSGHGDKLWTAALQADRSWSTMSLSGLSHGISTEALVALSAWVAVVLRLVYRSDDEV